MCDAEGMNSIHSFLSGLFASLFFAAGFERIARRLDPLSGASRSMPNLRSTSYSTVNACNWRPQAS